MFTGLIEETGTLQNLNRGSASCVLKVGCREVLENTKIGDSIAVNGVCLTVTSLGSNYFTADAMPETLNRSSLGELRTGSLVNLERAMPADGRFGGHIVSGHIDGTGTIEQILPDANAVWYTVSAPAQILRYIVEKGSITIDGISLTVAYVDEKVFKVSIIPHTQKVTALHEKHIGSIVNLECDIIGKYVEKLLTPYTTEKEADTSGGGLTEEFLRSHGF
ncbi:MAG: riboflavin synthase [Lachnospiraceae bacterium]|nr:riboflavin synthase [Lachnospiraceae bacterium]